MDKVNEKAWLLYPDKKVVLARGNTCLSCGKVKREAYLEGYYQAQKDLALTWQDIETIYDIFDWMANDDWLDNDPNFDYSNREQYFKEALKRFNKYKEDSRI